MRYLGLISLLFVSAFAEYDIYWKNNLTVSSANNDLSGRFTILTVSKIGLTGLFYTSVEYEAGNGQASADGLTAAAFATANGPLASYLAYFDATATWTTTAATANTADVSAAAAMIGSAYLALVEVDANGNPLSALRLRTLSWSISDAQTKGPLKYATFTGTSSTNANFSISFTFAGSDVTGVLTNGAVLTPKSLQTTINILNYAFTSPTSSLRLVIGVGTASLQASGSVSRDVYAGADLLRLRSGTGSTSVYFDGSANAFVDGNGNQKSVTIVTSGAAEADFDNAPFISQLNSIKGVKSNIQVDLKIVNITLPQSNNITYDPGMGAGNPPGSTSSAHALKVETSQLMLFSLMAVLVAKSL